MDESFHDKLKLLFRAENVTEQKNFQSVFFPLSILSTRECKYLNCSSNFSFLSWLAGQDAVHITAILGESVIFNCHVEFPGDHPVPYVLQWEKKVSETVIINSFSVSLNHIFVLLRRIMSLRLTNIKKKHTKKTRSLHKKSFKRKRKKA